MAAQKYPNQLPVEPPLQGESATLIRWARGVVGAVNAILNGASLASLGNNASEGGCYFFNPGTGALLTLAPERGNLVFIAGQLYPVPAAGVSVAPTGLTPGNAYNIYAFVSNGQVVLEASLTPRATDPTYGHQIKAGDPSRSLVGKSYVQAGPVWDTANPLLTISWLNKRRRNVANSAGASSYTTTTTPTEVAPVRVFFASWGTDSARVRKITPCHGSSSGVVYFDQAVIGDSLGNYQAGMVEYFQPPAVNSYGTYNGEWENSVAENLGTSPAYWFGSAQYWSNSAGAVFNIDSSETIVSING